VAAHGEGSVGVLGVGSLWWWPAEKVAKIAEKLSKTTRSNRGAPSAG